MQKQEREQCADDYEGFNGSEEMEMLSRQSERDGAEKPRGYVVESADVAGLYSSLCQGHTDWEASCSKWRTLASAAQRCDQMEETMRQRNEFGVARW